METDKPLDRTLRIGRATIGLIGLDRALSRVLAETGISRSQAVESLYQAVAEENYIPPGKEPLYREALAREYDRLMSGGERESSALEVRILGPGCVSCNNLQKLVIEVVSELGLAADVFQVHDLDEIGRFGVMTTPALVINGKVVASGRIPPRYKIEEWLREAVS